MNLSVRNFQDERSSLFPFPQLFCFRLEVFLAHHLIAGASNPLEFYLFLYHKEHDDFQGIFHLRTESPLLYSCRGKTQQKHIPWTYQSWHVLQLIHLIYPQIFPILCEDSPHQMRSPTESQRLRNFRSEFRKSNRVYNLRFCQ